MFSLLCKCFSVYMSLSAYAKHAKNMHFNTSPCCRWQTLATQYLMLTVLYTDVDSRCDKLVTDDGHQFTTQTVHLS